MVWEITTEELLKKYTSGNRNFAGAVVVRSKTSGQTISISKCCLAGY